MKKIFITILVLISVQSFGQGFTKKYFERMSSAGVIDSGYVRVPGDSVFLYLTDAFVTRTKEYYSPFYNPVIPDGFSNFTLFADGVYRNFLPRAQTVRWDSVNGKPSAVINLSGTNTGDNATNTQYSGLAASKQDALGFTPLNPANNLSEVTPATARTNLGLVIGTNVLAPNGNGSSLTNLTASQVSLGNVDNTSDANKPVSSATQTALNLKANIASPIFTGTVSGITSTMVGLGNVTNESKSTMFTNAAFTGTFNVTDGSIANSDLANSAVANLSGTNTGDNAANTTYANDYRAANFIAGTNYLAPNGSAAALTNNTGGWTELVVSGSNATTTGQVLVDITGLVSGTLSNSTKYEVEVILDAGTSAVTTGTQYAIQTGGTGGAGVVSAIILGTTTVNAATQVTLSAPNAAIGTFLTTSGTSGIIKISGFVTTRGTGTATISVQHLKVTSGTSTVRTGSKMRIRLAQ